MSENCIFCKIIDGQIPCFKLFEDENTLAFMDINPVHPGHALIIPKQHAANLFEVSTEALLNTVGSAQMIARAVQRALSPDGMNLLQCNGEAAAQSVMHFHVHVLPRQADDNVPMNWNPQPGDMDEIGRVAEQIRAQLDLG